MEKKNDPPVDYGRMFIIVMTGMMTAGILLLGLVLVELIL